MRNLFNILIFLSIFISIISIFLAIKNIIDTRNKFYKDYIKRRNKHEND